VGVFCAFDFARTKSGPSCYNVPVDELEEIPRRVDGLLAEAVRRGASDIHIEPARHQYELLFRVDGELQSIESIEPAVGRAVINRLMVLAQLLTYRLDVPQEGKLNINCDNHGSLDLRLAVIPTVQGLRAAIRLPADLLQPRNLDQLGLPAESLQGLRSFAASDSGMLIVTGPAGSGKTTTLYALLAEIHRLQPGLSIITLEDPVERCLDGITQIEVSPFGQLTYEKALRSILRQDPQVLMLGEIRDAATASLAVQAALSGHRLLCTLHAADPAGAIARLLEMGLEPYQITSALFGVLTQRLLRIRRPEGGYRGRTPAAEFVAVNPPLRQAIIKRQDAESLRAVYSARPGHLNLIESARRLVAGGVTDEAEARRVVGA
jgi:general secretion pathway protein E